LFYGVVTKIADLLLELRIKM